MTTALIAVPGGWMIEGDDNTYATQADALYTNAELQALARDIERCGIALGVTTGNLRRRWLRHYKACQAAIKAMPIDPETATMTDDELLAALGV